VSGEVTVCKLDATGREMLRYQGELVERGPNWVRVAATFERGRTEAGPLTIHPGDRLVETFYDDRWYNVFAVFSSDESIFRGWYCNIARPAKLGEALIAQDDLALDLVVLPDGGLQVLDRAEFEALELPPGVRRHAEAALADLLVRARRRLSPFRQSDGPPA
jgi:hypothetical protein